MYKKYWFVCLALGFMILAIITGCETLQKAATSGGREYFPNTDGYSWTFRLSSSTTTEIATAKFTANGTTSIDGITVQKLKVEMISGAHVSTSETLVRVTDSDVTWYTSASNPTSEALKMISFPLTIGSKWIVNQLATMTSEGTVLSQENVGSYNDCFKVKIASVSSPGNTIDFWLAKDVGVAKVLITNLSGTTETTNLAELTGKSF